MGEENDLPLVVIGTAVAVLFLILLNGFQKSCEKAGGHTVEGAYLQCVKDGKVIRP